MNIESEKMFTIRFDSVETKMMLKLLRRLKSNNPEEFKNLNRFYQCIESGYTRQQFQTHMVSLKALVQNPVYVKYEDEPEKEKAFRYELFDRLRQHLV